MREEKSKFYTGKGYLKAGRYAYRPLYTQIINLLPKPHKCPTIIDLGCGIGYFAGYLCKLKYDKYIGFDFSKTVLELAKKHTPKFEYVLLNLYDDNFEETVKNYNLFTIIETLEHIVNDFDVLNKLPSKSLIVGSVPNSKSQGHVRIFKGVHDVFNRYQSIIKFNFFTEFILNNKKPNNVVTIFRGIKK